MLAQPTNGGAFSPTPRNARLRKALESILTTIHFSAPSVLLTLRSSATGLRKLHEGLVQFPVMHAELQACGAKLELIDAMQADLATANACADLLKAVTGPLRDGDLFAVGFDAKLDELRVIFSDLPHWLVEFEVAECVRTGIAGLRVAYMPGESFYIEIPLSQVSMVPSHYQPLRTSMGGQHFTHPELIDLKDRSLISMSAIQAREDFLYLALLEELVPLASTLKTPSVFYLFGGMPSALKFASFAMRSSAVTARAKGAQP